MNLVQQAEIAKDLSDKQLQQELLQPTGSLPSYVALSELNRRKQMRASYAGAKPPPSTSIAEEFTQGIGGQSAGNYEDAIRQAEAPPGMGSQPTQPGQAPQDIMGSPMPQPPQGMSGGQPIQGYAAGGMVQNPMSGNFMTMMTGAANPAPSYLPGTAWTLSDTGLTPDPKPLDPKPLGLPGAASPTMQSIRQAMIHAGISGTQTGGDYSDNGGVGPSPGDTAATAAGVAAAEAAAAAEAGIGGNTGIGSGQGSAGTSSENHASGGLIRGPRVQHFDKGGQIGRERGLGPFSYFGDVFSTDNPYLSPEHAMMLKSDDRLAEKGYRIYGDRYRLPPPPTRYIGPNGPVSEAQYIPAASPVSDRSNHLPLPPMPQDGPSSVRPSWWPTDRVSPRYPEDRMPSSAADSYREFNAPPPETPWDGPPAWARGKSPESLPPGLKPHTRVRDDRRSKPTGGMGFSGPEPTYQETPVQETPVQETPTGLLGAPFYPGSVRNPGLTEGPASAGLGMINWEGTGDETNTPISPRPGTRQARPPAGPGSGVAGNPVGSGGGLGRGGGSAAPVGGGSGMPEHVQMIHDLQQPDRFGELEKANDADRAKIKESISQNKGMALLETGAAIMGGESPFFMTNVGRGAQAGIKNWQGAQREVRQAERDIRQADNAIAIARANRDERQLEMAVKGKWHAEEIKARLEESAARRAMDGGARADALEERRLARESLNADRNQRATETERSHRENVRLREQQQEQNQLDSYRTAGQGLIARAVDLQGQANRMINDNDPRAKATMAEAERLRAGAGQFYEMYDQGVIQREIRAGRLKQLDNPEDVERLGLKKGDRFYVPGKGIGTVK